MSFILRMAWRDTRASRRRLLLYSLSIVLGVAALSGISSLGDNLRSAVDTQAKGLLGADLAVNARQTFSAQALAKLRPAGIAFAQGITTSTMVSLGEGQRRLVQLNAVEGPFPFYGEVETAPAGMLAHLADGHNVLVEETALTQSGLAVGSRIRLGTETFTVIGALKKYPGQSPMASMFSPRLQISMAALKATGLLQKGSLSQHSAYLKLADRVDAAALETKLRAELRGERMSFTTAEQRKEQLGDALKNVFSFISLVGFLALFLGAVGVASAMHVFIRQRIATVAVLRCLGASARTSFSIYLVQGIGLGVVGSGLGLLVGLGLQYVMPMLLKDYVPYRLEFVVSWPAMLKGLGAGVGVSALFTLLPLLEVRRVSPLLVLRSGFGENGGAPDPWRWGVYAAIGAAMFGFATLQTGYWEAGLAFSGAMIVSFGVLGGTARGIIWVARRARTGWLPYTWRQGVANVHRPNNRTLLLMMSLGLGTFLLLTLGLTRAALLARLTGMGAGDRPNLMFFDVQADQIDQLDAIARREGVPLTKTSPIVTMRLSSLKGRTTEELSNDPKGGVPPWALRREYRSTYRAAMDDAEKITEGKWVSEVPVGASRVPVSIEASLAKDLQVKVGDELEFNVQGVPVKAVIGSVRHVEWQRMQANFYFVFPPGPLDGAPATFAAAARARSPGETARLQQAVAKELPNVSAIDLGFVLRLLDGIFTKIAWAVSFLASFTVATGVVVLVSAVLMGRHQRVREAVLLRTLGAQRAQLRQIMLAEYTVLGLLAATTGGALAVAANGLLATFLFKVSAVPPLPLVAAGIAAVTVLTIATGLLANRGVSGHPPLEVLRQET
ncbi:MAG: ABC transporter permease [Opitutae bacterium]|nr:ABC transporter permease [Opitutae bacterium]